MNKNKNTILKTIILFILGITSGWSQEQVGIAFIMYTITDIVWDAIERNKSKNIDKWVFLIGLIIGFIGLMIAPGNYARRSEDEYGNLILGIMQVFTGISQINSCIIYIITLLLLIYLVLKANKLNSKVKVWRNITLILVTVSQLMVLEARFYQATLLVWTVINAICITMLVIIYTIEYKDKIILCLFVGMIVSLGPIIMSPYFVERMMLPALIFLSCMIIYLVNKHFLSQDSIRIRHAILSIVGFSGLLIYITTCYGYFENSLPKNLNNKILREEAKNNAKGITNDYLILFKNINEKYTGTQPYELDYTESMKRFFGVDQQVQLLFVDYPANNAISGINYYLNYGKENQDLYQNIDFTNSESLTGDLLKGYYAPEEGFCWTENVSICKLINNNISVKGLKIKFTIPEYLNTGGQIDIYVNGEKCKNIVIDKERLQDINLLPEQLPKSDNNEYMVTIQSSESYVPKDIGINDDTRLLALMINYIGEIK